MAKGRSEEARRRHEEWKKKDAEMRATRKAELEPAQAFLGAIEEIAKTLKGLMPKTTDDDIRLRFRLALKGLENAKHVLSTPVEG